MAREPMHDRIIAGPMVRNTAFRLRFQAPSSKAFASIWILELGISLDMGVWDLVLSSDAGNRYRKFYLPNLSTAVKRNAHFVWNLLELRNLRRPRRQCRTVAPRFYAGIDQSALASRDQR